MAGLGPAIHVLQRARTKTWMAGPSPRVSGSASRTIKLQPTPSPCGRGQREGKCKRGAPKLLRTSLHDSQRDARIVDRARPVLVAMPLAGLGCLGEAQHHQRIARGVDQVVAALGDLAALAVVQVELLPPLG